MQAEKNKILIIDDSMLTLKLLEDILRDTYDVIIAQCGEDGLKLALEEQPDLILLDIEMPRMNGFEVLKNLQSNRKTEPIPVIFLTGLIEPKYEERGFLCGAVDYIVKPYNNNVVKVRVKTHITLSNYRRQIEKQLNIDTLTELYNRRGLENYVKEVAIEAVKEHSRLNFVIFDIDFFKQVNDTYGHLQGDHALQKVASILSKCASTVDGYVARYGGEEFAVVLPRLEREEVERFMENICASIRAAQIPNEKSSVAPYLTISAGGAGKCLDNALEALDLLKQADEMLYKSKEEGRDRYSWNEVTE